MTVIYYIPFPTRLKAPRSIGVSGTETATYVVMEQLAITNPNEKYVILGNHLVHDSDSNAPANLFFMDSFTDELINSATTFISSIQFNLPLNVIKKMVNLQHVIFVTHTPPCGAFIHDFNEIKNQQKRISIVYLCNWTRSYIDHLTNHAIDTPSKYIIGNPLMTDCLQPLTCERLKNSFVFLATWERGGNAALEAFKQIRKIHNDATFHIASYHHDLPSEYIDQGIYVHKSLGKKDLSILLSKTEYFLYPLTLPSGQIHKDTFACCVSEAIASGVQVITYAQGALVDIYGDLIDIIPIPIETTCNSIKDFNFHAYEPWLNSKDGINNIASHVLKIMGNQNQDEIKRRAYIIRNKYSEITIRQMWNDVINDPVRQHLYEMSLKDMLPKSHVNFLHHLKNAHNFTPRVIFDIGACVLHWTKKAKEVWPEATSVLFDAMDNVQFLYEGSLYHIGLLSDQDDKDIRFFENLIEPGGNSYYKENNDTVFPPDKYKVKISSTLDTVVAANNFPQPDLIKIDVQGAEKDIIKGALKTLQNVQYLIVEMQSVDYNRGAPKVFETKPFIESLGWECIAEKFSDNGPDADYCFRRIEK